jgi:hypothetical protein
MSSVLVPDYSTLTGFFVAVGGLFADSRDQRALFAIVQVSEYLSHLLRSNAAFITADAPLRGRSRRSHT